LLATVDQAALHGTERGFALALARGALRELEHRGPVRGR
jgi:hypothetical protein